MKRILPACILSIVATGTRPCIAHEFWFEPSIARAQAGDTVAVRAFVGSGFRGEIKPWTPTRTRRFELRTARPLDLSRAGVNGDLVCARVVLPDDGGALLIYESDFAFIELEAARFDSYLAAEGLDGPRARRARNGAAAGPGRERYARCCKAWIAGRIPERLLEPAGLRLEIVPLADPDSVAELPVQVLFEGHPLPGALLRTWCAGPEPADAAARDSIGPAGEARTDAGGRATLRCDRRGEWLVNVVHMLPSDDGDSDWKSWWASLTFVRGGSGAEPADRSARAASRRRP